MGEKEVKRIGQHISSSLAKWRENVKEGKTILDTIKERLYEEDDKTQKSETSEFDVEVCELMIKLDDIVVVLSEVVSELRESCDKAIGVEQLKNLSMNSTTRSLSTSSVCDTSSHILVLPSCLLTTSDLVSWNCSLVQSYSTQVEMNRSVAKSFCHLKSREEALFLLSVWLLQPGLDSQCQVAQFCLSQLSKEPADNTMST